eukprot:scaffold4225_cov128-Cylindrotheca_fusiformis.AAC.7
MASRNGNFLKKEDRDLLIKELEGKGEWKPASHNDDRSGPNDGDPIASTFGTGCLCCGEDNDHANILLCEGCNDEYHTYCLDPPLRSVPTGDWYCSKCKVPSFEDDGLDQLVSALPPAYTSRFGEVCWAQGGNGFGYWPSLIYDPRLTVGSARQLAKKNIGKRHLLYFFECHDAPFAVMPESRIQKWEDGLIDDLHMGKAAKSNGKARFQTFRQAMQAATIEAGKPKEMRMDWNHNNGTTPAAASPPNKKKKSSNSRRKRKRPLKALRGFEFLSPVGTSNDVASNRNLMWSLEKLLSSDKKVVEQLPLPPSHLCCKVFKTSKDERKTISEQHIGFVKLDSRSATFRDARVAIERDLMDAIDDNDEDSSWRFVLPTLGPMSQTQEQTLGPLLDLIPKSDTADGSVLRPLDIHIEDVPPTPATTKAAGRRLSSRN